MSLPSPDPEGPPESSGTPGAQLRAWAEDRAVVLLAVAILFGFLAVVVIVSSLHPR